MKKQRIKKKTLCNFGSAGRAEGRRCSCTVPRWQQHRAQPTLIHSRPSLRCCGEEELSCQNPATTHGVLSFCP